MGNLAAAVSGAGYAVITTIPNALVTMYHEDPLLYYGPEAGKAGVGEDIAILDSGYYLSQIWLSLIMGKIVEMTGLAHYYIIVPVCPVWRQHLWQTKWFSHLKIWQRPNCTQPHICYHSTTLIIKTFNQKYL